MALPQQFLLWASWTGLSSSSLQPSGHWGPGACDHTGPELPHWCLGSGSSLFLAPCSEAAKTDGKTDVYINKGIERHVFSGIFFNITQFKLQNWEYIIPLQLKISTEYMENYFTSILYAIWQWLKIFFTFLRLEWKMDQTQTVTEQTCQWLLPLASPGFHRWT